MNKKLSESAIVKALAEKTIRRITRKTIADLQRMDHLLSGEDSGLSTTWDEICTQVQHERSFAWDAYDETVEAIVSFYVDELPAHEREAIWLQTEPGFDWDCEETHNREPYPIVDDDVTEYIINEYIYTEAGRWSNVRIRKYIERSSMRD